MSCMAKQEGEYSQKLYDGLIEAVMDAVVSVDKDQNIVVFNRAAEKTFGYLAADVIGKPLDFLIPAAARAKHRNLVEGYGKGKASTRLMGPLSELTALRADGSCFPITASISKIDLGSAPLYTAVVRDMTVERSALMQLRQSERLRAIGQLTGGIAHDFNNILAVIGGCIEMANYSSSAKQKNEHLQRASSGVKEAVTIVSRLLSFARPNTKGKVPMRLPKSIMNISPLLRGTVGGNIEIITELDNDLWPAIVDESQLGSAILNLALNARDAMPGGGKLTISAKNYRCATGTGVKPVGDFVVVTITDTGCGMLPHTLEKAAEPFFTTKASNRGTGLGLSMVCRFIEDHHGQIRIESEVDVGTTVNLYLPRYDGDMESIPDDEEDVQQIDELMSSGRQTILYVEDNHDLQRINAEFLERLGYTVHVVDSADGAIQVLKDMPSIDLLFTDIRLGMEKTGMDLAEKASVRYPKLKIILYTGNLELLGSSQNRWPVLHKPVPLQLLAKTIHKTLRSS